MRWITAIVMLPSVLSLLTRTNAFLVFFEGASGFRCAFSFGD